MGRCSRELQDKVASAVWDSGKYGGEIYGVVRCELRELLTAEEKAELVDWIKHQNDSGIGARAEQIPLEAGEGTLFVGFNVNEPGSFVFDEKDFEEFINSPQCKYVLKSATPDDLRGMHCQEGLVLQGCGGSAREWLTGINEMLTEESILRDGSQFREASVFEHSGLTNILFHMDDVDLDVGKLAMWRLQSHEQFGGTWLSDYRVNQLGVGVDEDFVGTDDLADEPVEDQGFGGMGGMA